MKYLKIICSCLIMSSLLLTGCGNNSNQGPSKVQEFGDIDNSELDSSSKNSEDTNSENTNLPYYDATNLVEAKAYSTDDKLQEKSSYYKEQLTARQKRAFDAIYNAASNMTGNIEFESSQFVTPSELKNIMNIIFLDCPEIFYLNNNYSYVVNSEGYATSVSLDFGKTAEQIATIKSSLAQQKPGYLENRKNNDYETIQKLLKDIDLSRYESVSIDANGNYNFSVCDPFDELTMGKNSIGASKLFCYWLRQLGIDSTVVVGEIVSNDLQDTYELTTDYLKYCNEYQVSDNEYKVEFNYSYYWLWNVVKIDDNWYNLDIMYSLLLNQKDKAISKTCLWFVPDRTMSQSRLFYMNEEILGISPSCTDINFEQSYREGNYILPHTETQMVLRIKQELASIDQENKESVYFQFEDEDSFNYFLDNFDDQVDYYNNTYGNAIGLYEIHACRDALSIAITNIINNY